MNGRRAEALEALVRPSVVRIVGPGGGTRGTGFAVAGRVLTCAHVVAGLETDEFEVESHEGARISVRGVVLNCDLDVAMLEVESDLPSLAVGPFERPDEILSIGFPDAAGVEGPIVSRGPIGGKTAILYGESTPDYALRDVWTLPGGFIAPGCSGAPVVDTGSGSVVGMVVAEFSSDSGRSGLAGFVQPIVNLSDDRRIGAVLDEADATVARFGPIPNQIASREWARLATSAILSRMESEGRYDRDRLILRKSLEHALTAFQASGAPVWAVVDQSGVGKSTGLARAAESRTDRPTLFLRAMDVDDPSETLNDLVREAFMSVAPGHVERAPTLAALAAAGGPPPLIIVDGLNEARISPADLRDRWLPNAVRAAAACKLVLTCRPEIWEQITECMPKKLFYADDPAAPAAKRRPAHEVGEFTDDELVEFSLKRGEALPRWLRKIRNPLLLSMAGELRSDIDEDKIDRWGLIAAFVRHHCRHSGDRSGVPQRRAETLAEHLAFACLERPNPVIAKSDPLTLDPAFQGLVDENLLVDERDGYGFRYDLLYEHLAARSLSGGKLVAAGEHLEQAGRPLPWTVVRAYCDRLRSEGTGEEIAAFLDVIVRVDGRKQAENILSCLAVLPLGDDRHDLVLRTLMWVAEDGMLPYLPLGREVAEANWSPLLLIEALRVHVLASSGYDFRANDLSTAERIARAGHQFELQGFDRQLRIIMAQGRERLLATLRRWHDDNARLGEIHGDISKESSVSSWVSCCLVFCASLLTKEELIGAMSPEPSASVFDGLALLEPALLAEIAEHLGGEERLQTTLFRHALRALNGMEEVPGLALGQSPRILACRLGLMRFDDLDDVDFKNVVVCWCASGGRDLAEQGWHRLIGLADAGEAESVALQAYLPHSPGEVIALARRKPEAFGTQTGFLLLDLAKPPYFHAPVQEGSEELSIRIDLLKAHIEDHGFDQAACGVIEDLLYSPDATSYEALGLMDLALKAVEQGRPARVLVHVAGDWNAMCADDKLVRANRLAQAIADGCPDREMVEQLIGKRAGRALKRRAGPEEIGFVSALAERAIARFGPELLIRALRAARGFLISDEAGRKPALLDALARLDGDPRIVAEIARLRAI